MKVAQRGRWLAWAGYAAVLAAAPYVFRSGLGLALATQVCIAIVACLSFNLLLGQGGMLSFGHAVYTGLGAYVAIHALNAASAGRVALPVSLVPLVGGLGGLFFAALLGFLTTRRAGTTFAMITLGLGELVFAIASMMTGFFGGEGGIGGNRVVGQAVLGITFGPERELYFLAAGYCLACTLALYAFTRTPLGRLLNAVRDNPERAAFIGLSARGVRYRSFMVSGFFAGIAGGLAALTFEIVTPDVVSPLRSGNYLLFTLLGGSTVFVGPIIGAVLMVLCSALLPGITKAWLLWLGLAFMAMVMIEPGGIAAWTQKRFDAARLIGLVLSAAEWQRMPSRLRRVGRVALKLSILVAVATLVEMLYRLQLDAALGPNLRFLGMDLDVSAPGAWIVAIMVAIGAAGLLHGPPTWRKARAGRLGAGTP